ncbi:CoA ester lyase [Pigmentiphaga soli]|uniref:CoA ester lyase n=1 Tax=Pigmentiphaga soli TaxID=1007095 RepID=A0ABP8HI37_9BURK
MRSLLFVPGHDARKLAKAPDAGADALILDLEDSVPEGEKARARQVCAEFVAAHRERLPLFVRINGLATGHALPDLAAVVRAAPHGIMLPKCEGRRDVERLADWLSALEARDGLPPQSTRILPIVTETAASLFRLGGYAEAREPRLCGLMWGGEDLAADLGATANRDSGGRYAAPYELARSLTLLGAAGAQVAAVDAIHADFRDLAGLQAEAEAALRDGFSAKAAIHPDQVGPINAAFTPSPDAVAWARQVVAALDASGGAAVALEGKMLDRPHYRAAQRIIARCGG